MLNKIIKKILNEATTDSTGARGSYSPPMQPGLRPFEKNSLGPFEIPVSKYKSPLAQYDSYDKKMDLRPKQIKELEKTAKKIQNYIKRNPYSTFSDEDGNNINQFMKDGKTPNKREMLAPYTQSVPLNEWIEITDELINEDLAVWFGKKKKPKGSKQPKGPWVNICRKVDGKHPPCGRPEASDKGYPKCRAAGVAGKMSDSEKRSACQQKRRAEKSNPKSGTGNKPKMVSYKPKNESVNRITESDIKRLLRKLI